MYEYSSASASWRMAEASTSYQPVCRQAGYNLQAILVSVDLFFYFCRFFELQIASGHIEHKL